MKLIENEDKIKTWFSNHECPEESIDVRVHILEAEKNHQLEEFLVRAIPTCYISNDDLTTRMSATGLAASEILQNKVPQRGSVMAGDFGEVLTLFFLGSERTEELRKVRKWRYKQDRLKAAPHSDVILMHKAHADSASTNDFVICAEAKLKSTAGNFSPIKDSIIGYDTDKTGRLARTLVWLKEKAIDHKNIDDIAFFTRFSDNLLDTSFEKKFKAVAIIDRNLLDDELLKVLELPAHSDEFEVVVLGIEGLKDLYQRSFEGAVEEVSVG